MKIKNFWIANTLNKEIKEAYKKQNIKKLEEFKSLDYDIIETLELKEHPLLDSLRRNLYKNSMFFMKNYLNESLLENAFILVKKENLQNMEKLLILFCQNKEKKLSYFSSNYRKNQKLQNFQKKHK
jgi:hypothetical protein